MRYNDAKEEQRGGTGGKVESVIESDECAENVHTESVSAGQSVSVGRNAGRLWVCDE